MKQVWTAALFAAGLAAFGAQAGAEFAQAGDTLHQHDDELLAFAASRIDETFQEAKACGPVGNVFFSIAQHSARWSYVMPRRFTPGRYTVDVQGVDALGNVTAGGSRGIDRIVFNVR